MLEHFVVPGVKGGLYLYEQCIKLARNSDCDKRKFGAVIARQYNNRADLVNNVEFFGTGFNQKIPKLENFDCCKLRRSIPSGTRTEYCAAIHAEMAALQQALKSSGHSSHVSSTTLYVAGLNGDGTVFNNSGGFYCLPCAKELAFAGIKRIALASAETPKTGKWIYVTMEEALKQSLEFTKGTVTVNEDSIVERASKLVDGWSDIKRAAWEQRTGLKLPPK